MTFNTHRRFLLIIFLFFMIGQQSLFATHIIGGEISYKCIVGAPSYIYKITLDFYRDCYGPHAEPDSTIHLMVYAGNNDSTMYDVPILLPQRDTLLNNTYNLCLFSPPDICVEKTSYSTNISLPPRVGGYYFVFQRCCRNDNIINIPSPLSTGSTWYIDIPDPGTAGCNSSPIFKLYPPTVLCRGQSFTFDHSAVDPEGDLLVYEICLPFQGGSPLDAAPKSPPKYSPPSPPYDTIATYNPGYSYQQPLGPTANMQINPNTGFLTINPDIIGKFVVAICVSEYRNGQLLSVNKRDFQFNVVDCLDDLNAQYTYIQDPCDSSKITFMDKSNHPKPNEKDSLTYFWDFGDGITDTTRNPFHSFSMSGTYLVKFTVNPGLSCESTFQIPINVNVISQMNANFSFNAGCVNHDINFQDNSFVPPQNGTITQWIWDFGDGKIDTTLTSSAIHQYPVIGPFTVQLIINSSMGCKTTDTVSKSITLLPNPDVTALPLIKHIALGESVTLTGYGALTYVWEPASYLTDSTANPVVATPKTNITYTVIGTDANGCTDTSFVTIMLENPVAIDVPSAFTPNGDGRNDEFRVYNIIDPGFGGIESVDFKIFNRWGEIVFETSDPQKGWNGKNKSGTEMEIGVYVWTLSVKTKTGDEIAPRFGNVSLIR